MGQLYPDFHAPIPSMSVIKMNCSSSTSSFFDVEEGERVVIGAPGYHECEFRTCYPVRMYPVDVTSGAFKNAPLKSVGSQWESHAHSVLKIQLTALDEETSLSEMGLERLRFYLNGNLS